jgi:hypothetical protein
MKAIRLLSKQFREADACANNTCPAIMEADNGDFLIIGYKPTGNEDLNNFAGIANDEQLVIVPREVLLKIKDLI